MPAANDVQLEGPEVLINKGTPMFARGHFYKRKL
jgi:hypothetical protein